MHGYGRNPCMRHNRQLATRLQSQQLCYLPHDRHQQQVLTTNLVAAWEDRHGAVMGGHYPEDMAADDGRHLDQGVALYDKAQRRWRVAQEAVNQKLGARRVVALHALLDECMDMLADIPDGNEYE